MNRLLFIDDAEDICMLFKETVEPLDGWVTDYASNPIEALKLIKVNRYQLVISDNIMPLMSGIEFFLLLKHENLQCQKILCTGDKDLKCAEADLILYKPFDFYLFKEIIYKSLRPQC